jgi:hypothetical protein
MPFRKRLLRWNKKFNLNFQQNSSSHSVNKIKSKMLMISNKQIIIILIMRMCHYQRLNSLFHSRNKKNKFYNNTMMKILSNTNKTKWDLLQGLHRANFKKLARFMNNSWLELLIITFLQKRRPPKLFKNQQ